MEFWLSYDNGTEKLQLPVNPEEFTIDGGQDGATIDTIGLGELNIIGKSRLREITLEAFFPISYAPYCSYRDIKKPYEYIELLKAWMSKGAPLTFEIKDEINNTTILGMPVSIESFSYGEAAGSRDVKYSLELKEYRYFTLKPSTINPIIKKVEAASANKSKARKKRKAPKNIYIIKKHDSYWKIARAVLGDGSKWKEVKLLIESQNIMGLPAGARVRI